MSTDTPIACSLSATELRGRVAEMRTLGEEALIAASDDGVVRFRDGTEIRERLEAIVAEEARCCPFLDLNVRDHAGELVLTMRAPEEAEAMVAELVSAFSGRIEGA